MTNFEWLLENHEDLVKELISGNLAVTKDGPCFCNSMVGCADCIFIKTNGSCESDAEKWLEEQHEEYMIPANTPIDTMVLVNDAPDDVFWHKRYFAGFEKRHGKIFYKTWADGSTSWSVEDKGTINWEYCKLAESTA